MWLFKRKTLSNIQPLVNEELINKITDDTYFDQLMQGFNKPEGPLTTKQQEQINIVRDILKNFSNIAELYTTLARIYAKKGIKFVQYLENRYHRKYTPEAAADLTDILMKLLTKTGELPKGGVFGEPLDYKKRLMVRNILYPAISLYLYYRDENLVTKMIQESVVKRLEREKETVYEMLMAAQPFVFNQATNDIDL